MEDQGVKLLGMYASPFVSRVVWALKHKGIEYEYSEEDLQTKSLLLLESNPVYQKVPVLIHDGKSICDSINILVYIDETWPQNPLLPEDPYERATVHFWAKFVEEKLTEGLRNILLTDGEEMKKEVKQFEEALEIFECEAKAIKKFFGGHGMGLLDLVFGWSVLWLEVVEEVSCVKLFSGENFPSLKKLIEELKDLELTRENLPPREVLVHYFQNIRKIVLASKANK